MAHTKEQIKAEIDTLDDQSLELAHSLIQSIKNEPPSEKPRSLMDKLRSVHINAPEDFAQDIDAYLNGEKCVG